MRSTVIIAALLTALGGTLTPADAGRGRPAVVVLAAQPHVAPARELGYEPSKRDREGDDDDQDEPRH
uniref:hypothetical protein n=1 Tax=Bradyrhizobium sp. (strain ORS 278) TaxID=114615 RepID=UPI0005A24A38|nr:hypothetical protein [Bradyrhizobium sp. ORS 278]